MNVGISLAQSDTTIDRIKSLKGISKINYLNFLNDKYHHLSPAKALPFAKQAYNLSLELKNDSLSIMSLNRMGNDYHLQGDYDQALSTHLKSLEIAQKLNYEIAIADACINIGNVFSSKTYYSKALIYYNRALDMYKKNNQSLGIADAFTSIAIVYNEEKNFAKALDYHKKSLLAYQKLNLDDAVATAYINIGESYRGLKNYKNALENYEKGLILNENLGITENVALCWLNIGLVYFDENKFDKAIESFNKSNKLGYEYKNIVKYNFEYLAQAYKKQKNYQKAFDFQQKLMTLKDSIFSKESEEKISELHTKFETVEKEKQIELLIKNNSIQKLELIQKNTLVYASIIIILLVMGLAILYYSRYRLKNKANNLLTVANNEIMQSIKEKEILLQEIHHRVKNNLQLISSLLSWQSEHISDSKMIKAIEESQTRIKSMALIHEYLYQSENLSQINLQTYLGNLINFLEKSNSSEKNIILNLNIQSVEVVADVAIPIGLIVNELISNAYKYAFIDRDFGKIGVYLSERNNKKQLVIEDEGVGLPKNYNELMKKSLGLQLVSTLTKQLRGELSIESFPLTRFTLEF